MNVSSVLSLIADQAVSVAAVSIAVLLIAVGLKAFALIKAELRGDWMTYDPEGFDQDS